MKNLWKMSFAILIVLCVLTGMTGREAASETAYLNMGSTSSTSGVYAWCVATASVINKADVGLNVTVVESGAALDNLRRTKEGAFDFSLCVDSASAMQMYRGTDTFKDEGWEKVRWLFLRNAIVNRLYVKADSGLKTFADLSGNKFSPGIPGASSTASFMKFNDILGTGIDVMPASLADAITAFQQGRIAGLQKSSPLKSLDASLLEVSLTTPLSVVGYSQEDIKKIREQLPYIIFFETPAGGIEQLPELGVLMEEAQVVGAIASSELSEEVGYKIVKAYVEDLETVAAAYAPIKGWDPIRDSFRLISEGGEIPIHAGLYKYCLEKGIEVPERFIPPEAK